MRASWDAELEKSKNHLRNRSGICFGWVKCFNKESLTYIQFTKINPNPMKYFPIHFVLEQAFG